MQDSGRAVSAEGVRRDVPGDHVVRAGLELPDQQTHLDAEALAEIVLPR